MNHHHSHYLGRVRGRRVALLLASALPLLAVDDVAQQQQPQAILHQQLLPQPLETIILKPPLEFYSQNEAPPPDDDENDWNENDDLLLKKKHVAQQKVLSTSEDTERGEDDCIITSVAAASVTSEDKCLSATQRLLEDETLTSLPALMPLDDNFWMLQEQETSATQSSLTSASNVENHGIIRYGNTVIPFRPFFDYDHQSTTSVSSSTSLAAVHSKSSNNQNATVKTSSSSTSASSDVLSPSTNVTSLDVNNINNATYVVNQTISKNDEEETTANASDTSTTATSTVAAEATIVDDDEPVIVDYASKSAGALILEKSAGWKGVSNLLNGDKDQYAMIPISNRNKSIVIGLSEDILLEQIVLANYERYSSHVRDFVVLGSQTMETWVVLGTYTAKPVGKKQRFDFFKPTWARYLKIIFLRHYGDEHYLTVSQISIHGRTMLQGFHEEWDEEEQLQQQEAAVAATAAAATSLSNDADATTDSSSSSTIIASSTILINEEAMDHQDLSPRAAKLQQDGGSNGSLSFEKKMRLCSFLNQPESASLTNSAVYMNGRRRRIVAMSATSISAVDQVITEIQTTSVASRLFKKTNSSISRRGIMTGATEKIGFNMTSTPSRLIQDIRAKLRQQHGLAVKIPKIYKQHLQEPSSITWTASEAAGQEGAMADEKTPAFEDPETKPTEAKSSSDSIPLATAALADSPGIDRKLQQHKDAAASTDSGTAVSEMESSSPTSAPPVQPQSEETTPGTSFKILADGGGKTKQSTAASASATKSASTITATTITTTTTTTAAVTTTAADDAADDALQETNTALTILMERFPSASCLEKLDFAQFKTKILQARPQRSQHGGSGTGNPGASMDPIFKKLTNEIRTLQTSLNVHDQFARESVACYQGLLLDLLVEQEALRHGHEERLRRLEEDVHNNLAWLVAISRFFSHVTFIFKSILGCCVRGLYVTIPSIVSVLVLSLSSLMPRIMTLIRSVVDHNAATAAVDHLQQGLGAAGGVLVLYIVTLVCAVAAGPMRRFRLRLAASSKGNATMTVSTTIISTTAAALSQLPSNKHEPVPPPPPLAATPPSKQLPKHQPLQQISNREKKKNKQVAGNKKNHKENTKTTNDMHCQ